MVLPAAVSLSFMEHVFQVVVKLFGTDTQVFFKSEFGEGHIANIANQVNRLSITASVEFVSAEESALAWQQWPPAPAVAGAAKCCVNGIKAGRLSGQDLKQGEAQPSAARAGIAPEEYVFRLEAKVAPPQHRKARPGRSNPVTNTTKENHCPARLANWTGRTVIVVGTLVSLPKLNSIYHAKNS